MPVGRSQLTMPIIGAVLLVSVVSSALYLTATGRIIGRETDPGDALISSPR